MANTGWSLMMVVHTILLRAKRFGRMLWERETSIDWWVLYREEENSSVCGYGTLPHWSECCATGGKGTRTLKSYWWDAGMKDGTTRSEQIRALLISKHREWTREKYNSVRHSSLCFQSGWLTWKARVPYYSDSHQDDKKHTFFKCTTDGQSRHGGSR